MILIFILLFILIMVYISEKLKEGTKNKVEKIISENNAKEIISATLIEGINGVNKGTFCYVTANDEELL